MTVPRLRTAVLAAAVLALSLVVAACGSSSSDKISLVAYSTPQEAYQEIIPAFQKTSAGKGTSFSQSYGASGDQERAVEAGLKADVVALSLSPDVEKLVKAGKVDANWDQNKYKGFVTNSVVVLATRKGNGARAYARRARAGPNDNAACDERAMGPHCQPFRKFQQESWLILQ